MANSFESVIKKGLSNYALKRAQLPKLIANESISHFKDNWRNQGFDDIGVSRWRRRKGGKDPGRAILVKSGRMRRSFISQPTFNRIKIINDAPYSGYHNHGTKRLPKRQFMGDSHNLNVKNKKIINRVIKTSL